MAQSLLPLQLTQSLTTSSSLDIASCPTISPSVSANSVDDHPDISTLALHGYKKIRKISKTVQGELIEAIPINNNLNNNNNQMNSIAIKIIDKKYHNNRITVDEDGLTLIVEENIIKEHLILYHLTKRNRSTGGSICKWIDFFDDDNYYYLCSEYLGNENLLQFTNKCHYLLKRKKLQLSSYKKVIKYLFWCLSSDLHWMHNDMNVCHLNLKLENIMIQNGNIIKNSSGEFIINPAIGVKICGFGLAEMFNKSYKSYKCIKGNSIADFDEYCSPKMHNDEMYAANKADIWSLGCILYYMAVGLSVYKYQNKHIDESYLYLIKGKIALYLKKYNLLSYISCNLLELINGMLNINEKLRFNSYDVLNSNWLSKYYKTYSKRILKISKHQLQKHKLYKSELRDFPYYRM